MSQPGIVQGAVWEFYAERAEEGGPLALDTSGRGNHAYFTGFSSLGLTSGYCGTAGQTANVLFIGDSLSAGYYATTQDLSFLNLLVARTGGVAGFVAGGGATTADVMNLSEAAIKAAAVGVSVLVMELGTNDAGAAQIPAATTVANMATMIGWVRDVSPACSLIILGMWGPGQVGDQVARDAAVSAYATSIGATFLSLAAIYDNPGNSSDIDNFHPSDAGHLAIADLVEPTLREMVGPRRLSFDGSDDYLLRENAIAATDKSFTYEAWFRTLDAAEFKPLLAETTAYSVPMTILMVNEGVLTGGTWDGAWGGSFVTFVGGDVTDGRYHHAVLSGDGANVSLYCDGVLVDGPDAATAGSWAFDKGWVGGAFGAWSFAGDIPVARMYPFGLTAPQVAQNHGAGYLWPLPIEVPVQIDDALWQVLAGDDASGWRDVTDECGNLVYSHVRPGGPASASFSLPADVWGLGYNEVRADMKLKVSYAGHPVWDGIILPRGVSYQGE